MTRILSWDIGGANIKAARWPMNGNVKGRLPVVSRSFEIWREKDRLRESLYEICSRLFPAEKPEAIAVTMTAELSDIFETKRKGVAFVLESVRACFPDLAAYVLNLSGEFVPIDEARSHPLDYAATNWVASAKWIARRFPNCLLLDVGSTTTDILPILDGRVCVSGRTDMARLASGELVFTGFLRTNLAAIVREVPVGGISCGVASEYFAVSGDVHLILGNLAVRDYTCGTPDGQPVSVDSARRRVARLVCADTEMLAAGEIDAIARHVCERQICQIRQGLEQVLARQPELRHHPVVVAGIGAFLGVAAAKSANLKMADLAGLVGDEELAVLPCVAAAHLLAERLDGE